MTSTSFTVFASGDPKGQPRARAFSRNGMVRLYDPATAEGWKSAIAAAVKPKLPATLPATLDPVALEVTFYFPRPRSHYRSGARFRELRPTIPTRHAKKPDIDNCIKAVMDALTVVGVWRDDAQVDRLWTRREWAGEQGPGAQITVNFS